MPLAQSAWNWLGVCMSPMCIIDIIDGNGWIWCCHKTDFVKCEPCDCRCVCVLLRSARITDSIIHIIK